MSLRGADPAASETQRYPLRHCPPQLDPSCLTLQRQQSPPPPPPYSMCFYPTHCSNQSRYYVSCYVSS